MDGQQLARPFIAWPSRGEFRASIKMVAVFLLLFYVFYGSAAYLVDYLSYKFVVGFEFEKRIPFVPATAAIYLSVGPMMLLSIFIVRHEPEMRLLLKLLCAQTLVGFCGFVLFPVENNFAAVSNLGELPLVYQLADLINLKNNELPSLHVCFAATMAFVYSARARPATAMVFHLWALSIAGSTLLMHEHNLLDLLTGYGLAWLGARWWQSSVENRNRERVYALDSGCRRRQPTGNNSL